MNKPPNIKIEDTFSIQTTEYITDKFKPILEIRVQIDKEKLHDFKTIWEAYLKTAEFASFYKEKEPYSLLLHEIADKIYDQLEFEVFKNETI